MKRRLFLTTLVSALGVNQQEALASGRHGSVAAQLPYMTGNGHSEAKKSNALGFGYKYEEGKDNN